MIDGPVQYSIFTNIKRNTWKRSSNIASRMLNHTRTHDDNNDDDVDRVLIESRIPFERYQSLSTDKSYRHDVRLATIAWRCKKPEGLIRAEVSALEAMLIQWLTASTLGLLSYTRKDTKNNISIITSTAHTAKHDVRHKHYFTFFFSIFIFYFTAVYFLYRFAISRCFATIQCKRSISFVWFPQVGL